MSTIRKWLDKLARNDAPVARRISRALGSDRASVFLEFAFAMPLLLSVSLFILEICLFWDAEIMANHAAFAVARIAKVNAYHGSDSSVADPYPQMKVGSDSYGADKIVTAMFMMTSTFAWMGSSESSSKVDFRNYFTIDKPLFKVDVDSDANVFVQFIGKFIKQFASKMDTDLRGWLNKKLKNEITEIMGGDFEKVLNTRFNMALQRTVDMDAVKTEIIPLDGSLAHPVATHPSDRYPKPEIVKVSIDYPLHRGGWLYAPFAYWKTRDSGGGTVSTGPVATGRYAMLVEPDKIGLSKLHADSGGGSDINPDDLKKQGERKAKKDVADTANNIDKWEKAVKKRVKLQGGRTFSKAWQDADFQSAWYNERRLWNKIKNGIRKYYNLLDKSPSDGGLCGNKQQYYHHTQSTSCGDEATPFGKCARSESTKMGYCKKVADRIKKIAERHDLFVKKDDDPDATHYVTADDARPGYTPKRIPSDRPCEKKQYFCPPYPNYGK